MSTDRVAQHQEVSELLQTGEPVALAVDQVPFEVESRGVKNTFCLLVPLMTESGLELKREQFRNRERVWWMLRPDISPRHIQVGTVWSGPIERSRAYGNPEKEKDHYQVRRADIRPGTRQFIEILNLKVAEPDLAQLLSPEGVPWPYPPLSRVIVRGGLSVIGTFRARYDFETQRVLLKALSDEKPYVYRLSRGDFEALTEIREYSYTANQWDAKAKETPVELSFVHEKDLPTLEERGEQIDGATDAQIVTWALEFVDTPEEGRRLFREVYDRAAQLRDRLDSEESSERVNRFLTLCSERERVVGLGCDVARLLATREGFQDLLTAHIQKITADRVADAIASRRKEIEEQTAEARAQLEDIVARTERLSEEYAERRQAWEEEFRREHGERVSRLEERETTVERQEKEMRERLEGLLGIYREESKRFADGLIAQLPVMQRLGMLPGASPGAPAAAGATGENPEQATHVQLEFPAFLAEPHERQTTDEASFLDTFRAVVAQHGFVFDDEDLVNFHVLVKTGLWTVLAGASGLGKSSLPRFYAQALGAEKEYLLVPVRPDWLDDRDVIGAFNALSGRYEPSPSGLVERLITAQEDERAQRGGIYILCLDEMNLARVEHYFAQFLSVLEQPDQDRCLHLFARGMPDPEDPYSPYRTVRLGKNIRLIGTVNVDETTRFFSPKVIDRVSIAALERPDLRRGLEGQPVPPPADVRPVHLEDYLSWVEPPAQTGETVDLILRIEEALGRIRQGLGFRVRDRMLRYIGSAAPLLGEDRALDLAVAQNVLPGLRLVSPRFMELIKELQGLLPAARFRRSSRLLGALEEDPESDFFQLL